MQLVPLYHSNQLELGVFRLTDAPFSVILIRTMSKLKNNPVAKALLQTDRRRTQFVPDKKKPNRNQLKYEDLKLKKEWEEI